MLKRLKLKNFKGWPEVDIDFGYVTGLFGTNSSGKTSLIQFILLLKQTREATDRAISLELNGDWVQLGTFLDVVYQHDDKRALSFAIGFRREQEIVLIDPERKRSDRLAAGHEFEVEAKVTGLDATPRSGGLRYTLQDNDPPISFSLHPQKDDPSKNSLSVEGSTAFAFKRTQGRPWPLPGSIKTYGFPDQARTYYQNAGFLADLESAFEDEMDRIYYLGPLREYPRRDYLWARSRPTDVGRRGEKSIDAILAATSDDKRNRLNLSRKTKRISFQEMIAYWLREMGLIASFKVEEIKEGSNRWQAKVVTRDGATEVLLPDVGFGVSQVLPVVTLLWYVPEGSTVILEQPEIHLHPLAQSCLADLILTVAKRRELQVIVESHSEHLLLRLQRRIAEGRIAGERVSADDVALYFCDAPAGRSELTRLDLDMFGNIRNWPKNFMGDAFGDAAAAEKARLQRMKAAE